MDRIGNGFALQKYGKRIVIRIHPIEKKDVMEGNLESVMDLLTSVTKELKESGTIYPWNMTISGYDLDPRHLAQIPEVVSWFRKVHEVYPYLSIFLSPFILNAYLLSLLDTEVVNTVRKTDLSGKEKKDIDAMAAILNGNEPGLGEEYRKWVEFETQFSVNMQQVQELNTQISFAATLYLSSHKLKKSVSEKALRDAFSRINSALDFV